MAKKKKKKNKNKKKATEPKKEIPVSCCSMKTIPYFGILIFVIGIIWLLDDLNFISVDISLWPLVFIISGLKLIIINKK
ncbi:hypothetical protein GF327_08185 [Candidatus Woesearchaeota archaeon]|nr:hypothetical protein [Candidatus Woesearchaeota archaeon]